MATPCLGYRSGVHSESQMVQLSTKEHLRFSTDRSTSLFVGRWSDIDDNLC